MSKTKMLTFAKLNLLQVYLTLKLADEESATTISARDCVLNRSNRAYTRRYYNEWLSNNREIPTYMQNLLRKMIIELSFSSRESNELCEKLKLEEY